MEHIMLKVGQKLWFVPSYRRGDPYEVTVEKVGRKWAKVGNRDRINVETLVMDGGHYSSPGRCYVSQQTYEDEIKLVQEWESFRRSIDYSIPKGVTIDRIHEARKILGIQNRP